MEKTKENDGKKEVMGTATAVAGGTLRVGPGCIGAFLFAGAFVFFLIVMILAMLPEAAPAPAAAAAAAHKGGAAYWAGRGLALFGLFAVDVLLFLLTVLLFKKNAVKLRKRYPGAKVLPKKWVPAAAVLGVLFSSGFIFFTRIDPSKSEGKQPAPAAEKATTEAPAAEKAPAAEDWRAALPGQPSPVVDAAGILSDEDARSLEETVRGVDRSTGGEIAVVFLRTLGAQSIEDAGIAIAQSWRLGKEGEDNGLLLLFAVEDRKNRIEVGYGWEGFVNDARAGDLLRAAVPRLREGKYAEAARGIVLGVEKFVLADKAAGKTGKAAEAEVEKAAAPVSSEKEGEKKKEEEEEEEEEPTPLEWFQWLLIYIGGFEGVFCLYCVQCLADSEGSGGGSSGGGRYRSSRRSSFSSSSSSSRRRGGGSFGGGGASGGW